MKIGITTSETSFENYPKWIKGTDDIEIIELSYETNDLLSLTECDGIVLTGGVDIMPESIEYDNAPQQFYPLRDKFEKEILALALLEKKPILGVCRGLQLINLYFGGDLILDLGPKNQTHKKGETDRIHSINIDKNSNLYQIVGQEAGEVNSAHHQAINRLAKCLNISAISSDGVVEAVECKPEIHPFLLAVQWHPERMKNQKSPFTKNIREAFLSEIRSRRK
jgi:putative glutamine amidotransferase